MDPKIFLARTEELGPIRGLGPLGLEGVEKLSAGFVLSRFNQILSNIIGIMTVSAGIWFIFQFLVAGFQWLGAGGDKARVQAAQGRMTSAIIGIAVVVAATFLISLIGRLLGFPDILNPAKILLRQLGWGG